MEGHETDGGNATFVTREGDVVSRRGVMIGGSADRLSGILVKKQEMKVLGGRLVELDGLLDEERRRQKALEEQVRELEKRLHRETGEKNEVLQEERDAETSLIRETEASKHAARTLEILRMEQDQLLGEADEIDAEMDRCNSALARIVADVKAAQAKVVEVDSEIDAISSDAEGFEARIVEIKLTLTSKKAALENGLNTARRLKAFQADGFVRLEQMLKDIDVKERKRREAKAQLGELESSLSGMYEEIQALDGLLKNSEGDYEEIEALLREQGGSISEVQGMREEVIRKIRMVEVEQSQHQVKLEAIESRVEERYQRPLAACRRIRPWAAA